MRSYTFLCFSAQVTAKPGPKPAEGGEEVPGLNLQEAAEPGLWQLLPDRGNF